MFVLFNLRFLCLSLWLKHWWYKPRSGIEGRWCFGYHEAWIADDLNQSEFDALVYAIWTHLGRPTNEGVRQIAYMQGKCPILLINMNESLGPTLLDVHTEIQLEWKSSSSTVGYTPWIVCISPMIVVAVTHDLEILVGETCSLIIHCVWLVILFNLSYGWSRPGPQPRDHKLSQYT